MVVSRRSRSQSTSTKASKTSTAKKPRVSKLVKPATSRGRNTATTSTCPRRSTRVATRMAQSQRNAALASTEVHEVDDMFSDTSTLSEFEFDSDMDEFFQQFMESASLKPDRTDAAKVSSKEHDTRFVPVDEEAEILTVDAAAPQDTVTQPQNDSVVAIEKDEYIQPTTNTIHSVTPPPVEPAEIHAEPKASPPADTHELTCPVSVQDHGPSLSAADISVPSIPSSSESDRHPPTKSDPATFATGTEETRGESNAPIANIPGTLFSPITLHAKKTAEKRDASPERKYSSALSSSPYTDIDIGGHRVASASGDKTNLTETAPLMPSIVQAPAPQFPATLPAPEPELGPAPLSAPKPDWPASEPELQPEPELEPELVPGPKVELAPVSALLSAPEPELETAPRPASLPAPKPHLRSASEPPPLPTPEAVQTSESEAPVKKRGRGRPRKMPVTTADTPAATATTEETPRTRGRKKSVTQSSTGNYTTAECTSTRGRARRRSPDDIFNEQEETPLKRRRSQASASAAAAKADRSAPKRRSKHDIVWYLTDVNSPLVVAEGKELLHADIIHKLPEEVQRELCAMLPLGDKAFVDTVTGRIIQPNGLQQALQLAASATHKEMISPALFRAGNDILWTAFKDFQTMIAMDMFSEKDATVNTQQQ
ncbi:hypothetical protein BCR43DRAFT_520633 [Syncephalastrum racemosum]|uniref:ASX DEUBAD domain-containing protein n=1 Tax=Syncephalastrum racemosum TaxID=13706 RepID=A0A1X2HVA4_SYNRA|nr:hypothetical protein BCR43DRAFT_520633 [Syncephalastrum racemosum]